MNAYQAGDVTGTDLPYPNTDYHESCGCGWSDDDEL